MNRRSFILGGASLLAAPAIVRCASLMPVRVRESACACTWVCKPEPVQILLTEAQAQKLRLNIAGNAELLRILNGAPFKGLQGT